MSDVTEAAETPPDPNAVNITVNGVPHVARKGQLVIEAARSLSSYSGPA